MFRIACLCTAVAGPLFALMPTPVSGAPSRVDGSWEGVLQAGAARLRIVFHLKQESEGLLRGTMDSPDQGALGIPLSSVRLEGDSLWIEVKVAAGGFAGALLAGDTVMAGSWSQSGLRLPLRLRKSDLPGPAGRPQDPLPPFPYRREDVSFASEEPGITLSGTLTMPPGDTPAPGIVLISGSGSQDRDETIFGHRPFLVLADHLTRAGFAVLRYDDRGVGGSTGSPRGTTLEKLALDVRGAVNLLSHRPEVDPTRIGLLGHSEGGLLGSMVALDSGKIAFLVLMASPGVPGKELLLMQSEALARASGVDKEAIARAQALNRAVYELAGTIDDSARIAAGADSALRSWVGTLSPQERAGLGDVERFLSQQVSVIVSPWFRSLLRHDPRTVLRKLRCPVLAIAGGKDLQVPPKENLSAIGTALTEGGNDRIEVRELPGLNHLLQTAVTGLPSEYGMLEETIAPAALSLIGGWITEQTRSL